MAIDPCESGICGADVPPLIGSTLTGVGLTLGQAAIYMAMAPKSNASAMARGRSGCAPAMSGRSMQTASFASSTD